MTDGESHPVNVNERYTQNDGWEEPEVSSHEPPRLTRRAGRIDAAPHNKCPSGRSREITLRPRSSRCHHDAFARSCRPTYGQCMTPCANSSTRRSLFTRTHGSEPCPVTLVSAGRTFIATALVAPRFSTMCFMTPRIQEEFRAIPAQSSYPRWAYRPP